MTPVFLHGVVPMTARKPDLDIAHQLTQLGDIAAITTTCPVDHLEKSDTAAKVALNHNRLLSAYGEQTAVAPVKFGAAFRSIAALKDLLGQKSSQFLNILHDLDGHDEYALTITLQKEVAPEAVRPVHRSGRDFLRARKASRDNRYERSREQTDFVAEAIRAIDAMSKRSVSHQKRMPERVTDMSFLVARLNLGDLLPLCAELDKSAAELGLEFKLTGPWPAYSFTQSEVCIDVA